MEHTLTTDTPVLLNPSGGDFYFAFEPGAHRMRVSPSDSNTAPDPVTAETDYLLITRPTINIGNVISNSQFWFAIKYENDDEEIKVRVVEK